MLHNFTTQIKGSGDPGGERDDGISSMAVGDIIDDDDHEESMEASICLVQP